MQNAATTSNRGSKQNDQHDWGSAGPLTKHETPHVALYMRKTD